MKHLFRRLGMYLRSDCYCFELEGDNSHCPAHGLAGQIVRVVFWGLVVMIGMAILVSWLQMPPGAPR
jgi:hypothetical protein